MMKGAPWENLGAVLGEGHLGPAMTSPCPTVNAGPRRGSDAEGQLGLLLHPGTPFWGRWVSAL